MLTVVDLNQLSNMIVVGEISTLYAWGCWQMENMSMPLKTTGLFFVKDMWGPGMLGYLNTIELFVFFFDMEDLVSRTWGLKQNL